MTSLRARSRAGETLVGCFLTWPVPGIVELAAIAGFDFVVIDSEHGFFTIESVADLIVAADGAGIAAIVRAPSADSGEVGRYLDAGAAGTLLPRVEGVAAVRTAISALKFAPRGSRGLGGVRANRYATVPLADFVRRANEETLVAVQIERQGALTDLPAIADDPDVDVLFVGPNDLSQALGVPGVTSSPTYRKALAQVASEAARAGKSAGIMVGRREDIPDLSALGYRFFTTSDRALVLESGRRWRESVRLDPVETRRPGE
ncbi:MAG TPA: aldolase/citrate lyase family protein [Thermoanaerobaculia bacterium]|nr:aldolase/citrate lyase family protein [Thermoanaerobaculia bacterium]